MSDRENPSKPRPYGQGALSLVLLGTALASGCAPHPDDVAADVRRGQYASREECRRDWADDDCEYHGSGGRWWGPYYSSSGRVYHYDGRSSQLARHPANALRTFDQRATPNEIYRSAGRYASAPAHPNAISAKGGSVSRGGFGTRFGGFSLGG